MKGTQIKKRELDEGIRLFTKSRYCKKLSQQTKNLIKNPTFQKELRAMLKKYPPLPENKLIALVGTKEQELKNKAWKDFRNKWGIRIILFEKTVLPILKGTVKFALEKYGDVPGITPISQDWVEQDSADFLPLQLYFKNKIIGVAPITQGRKAKTELYKQMRKEFQSLRIEGISSSEAIETIQKNYFCIKDEKPIYLSDKRIRSIVYSCKYD